MSETRPVLNQINLVVRDMEATLAFYARLGLEFPTDPPRRSPHHNEVEMPNGFALELDSSEMARVYNAGARPPGGGGAVIGFSLASRESVDQRYAELTAAGDPGVQPPYDAFWGARYAIVADPDGNHVGLMSPIDPARRSRSPQLG